MNPIARRLDRVEEALTVENKPRFVWLEPGQSPENDGAAGPDGERVLFVSWKSADDE
jgi:hypothetical protein